MLNDLSKYFMHVEELIIRGMTIKLNPVTHLKIKYLDLEHAHVNGTLPPTLETLMIDSGVLESKRIGLSLPKLKNLYLSEEKDNYIRTNKYLEKIDWGTSMPNLEIIVFAHTYQRMQIDLTHLQKLKRIYYLPSRHPCKFIVQPSTELVPFNSNNKGNIDKIFVREIMDQQHIFDKL